MEEAPENSKESKHSAHAKGMNNRLLFLGGSLRYGQIHFHLVDKIFWGVTSD